MTTLLAEPDSFLDKLKDNLHGKRYLRMEGAYINGRGDELYLGMSVSYLLFEGEKKKVEEIIGWCHRGPSGAQVTSVNITWEPYRREFGHFDIRYGR